MHHASYIIHSRFDTEILHFFDLIFGDGRLSMCPRMIHAQTGHEKSCVRTCSQSAGYILPGPRVSRDREDAPPRHRLIPSKTPTCSGSQLSLVTARSLRSRYASLLI